MDESPTGKRKHPSGAQKRKQKRERERQVQPGVDDDGYPIDDVGDLEAFRKVGDPPLTNLNKALRWSRKLLMVVTYQVATSSKTKLAEKRYAIADMVAKLGMTHAKSLVDEDLETVEQRIGRGSSRKSKANAQSTAGITKPETARATRANRGSKPVRRHVPRPPAEEKPGDDPLGGR